jgi:hypothetical protein
MRPRALFLALCLGATAVCARAADAPVIGVPACTGLELAPEPWTHREYGHDIPGVALRNTSLRTCRVAGFPAVRFYLTTGKLARVKVVQKYLLDNRTYTYVIVPGNSAFFAIVSGFLASRHQAARQRALDPARLEFRYMRRHHDRLADLPDRRPFARLRPPVSILVAGCNVVDTDRVIA